MSHSVQLIPTVKLSNGMTIQAVGFATMTVPAASVKQAVLDAIDIGYRHIASSYSTQEEVGKALKTMLSKGYVKREELFISCRLWRRFHYEKLVKNACKEAVKKLGLNYIDCYFMEWPSGITEEFMPIDKDGEVNRMEINPYETWRAMEELVTSKLCRSIGVSNCSVRQLKNLLRHGRIVPLIIENECHPHRNHAHIMELCRKKKITFTALSPVGKISELEERRSSTEFGVLLRHPVVIRIANEYNKTTAQVLIRYQLDRGNIVIINAENKAIMAANFSIGDFQLNEFDVAELNRLEGRRTTMSIVESLLDEEA